MAATTDQEIEREIRATMAVDEHLGTLEIEIRVTEGVVVLRGTVDSAMQRSLAEEAARAAGVHDVVNELEVSGEPIAGTARRRQV
jgi:osmotically-inducible protein OsmY